MYSTSIYNPLSYPLRFNLILGTGGPFNLAYPCPHLPPYPQPTLIQPVAQLRQPYLVTITNSVALPSNRLVNIYLSMSIHLSIRLKLKFSVTAELIGLFSS